MAGFFCNLLCPSALLGNNSNPLLILNKGYIVFFHDVESSKDILGLDSSYNCCIYIKDKCE